MKHLFSAILGIALGLCAGAGLINACAKNVVPPIKEIVYVPTPDTMSVQEIIVLKEQLRRTQDSLAILKSDTTMAAELFVAKYKLERIRYYNDIAKKGNNIKFLRGWINRTLEE